MFKTALERVDAGEEVRVLSESRILFYEKLIEYRNNTIHLAHEEQKGNPKIKSRSTELAGFFEMNQMAHAIYDEYLRKNASNKIACSEVILKEIKDKLSEVYPYIFDDLIIEMRDQIAKEFLPSFSLSSHSKKGKQLLDWYQTYNDFPESIKIAVQSKLNLNSTDSMILLDIPLTTNTSYNSKSLSSSRIIPGPNVKSMNPLTFDQVAKESKLKEDQEKGKEIHDKRLEIESPSADERNSIQIDEKSPTAQRERRLIKTGAVGEKKPIKIGVKEEEETKVKEEKKPIKTGAVGEKKPIKSEVKEEKKPIKIGAKEEEETKVKEEKKPIKIGVVGEKKPIKTGVKEETESKSPLLSKDSLSSKSPLSSEIIPKETMMTSAKPNANGHETLDMPDINFNITGKSKDDTEIKAREEKLRIQQRPQSAYPTKKGRESEEKKAEAEAEDDIIEDDEIY